MRYFKVLPLAFVSLLLLGASVSQRHSEAALYAPAMASPTPPDICPSNGSPFETSLGQMPIPHPTPRKIDSMCPRGGKDDGNEDHKEQNAAKNNFLAHGTPIVLTFDDLTVLQKATDQKIASGQIQLHGKYPADRTKLKMSANGKQLGEGTLVTLEALVYSAHYSNTKFNLYQHNQRGSGEANNCNCNRVDWNDIHIALVQSIGDGECNSATAEISPHYRSELWSRFHDGQIPEIQSMLPGLLRHRVIEHKSGADQPLKVRITGPLFYDASHQPCLFNSAGTVIQRNSPARRSIWEIHPAYRIQVFDTATNKWLELDEWAH